MDRVPDFDLISFPKLQSARVSERPIPSARLAGRNLVVRTSRGNIAKLHVRSGEVGLIIDRLTVYTWDSCITQMASNLTLRSGRSFDLDSARESRTAGDLRWRPDDGGAHVLEPMNGAALLALPDKPVGALPRLERGRIRTDALGGPLHLRTPSGRLARFTVEAGRKLRIRDLVVLDSDGDIHLRRAEIVLPPGATLDLDKGRLGSTTRYHLRYEVGAAGDPGYLSAADAAKWEPSTAYDMFKYMPLFNSSAIRSAMVFEDADGALAYDDWSDARKAQLREWLHMRETGQSFPLAGPPPIDENLCMRPCSAWKIYLAHVVQSFWVDANQLVPWRLLEANAETLEHLLGSRRLLHFGEEGHKFASTVMGKVTDWSPFYSWDFIVRDELLGPTQWSTVKRVVDWARGHLIHIAGWENDHVGGPFESQQDQWEWIFGYRGPPPVHRMVEPRPGRRHITHGCWGTDGFLAAVLRAVNIPVRHGRTNLNENNHSRPEFFTVGRNLVHGDDPYNATHKLGVNNVPIGRIFRTDAEIESEIDDPELLPGMTAGETASFHHRERFAQLAVEFKTNWLLRKRCADQQSGASGPGSELGLAIGEYYTASELAQIEADCDAALAAIPDGCNAVREGA